MAMDNINDFLSLATILLIIAIPLYYIGNILYLKVTAINERRIEKMMEEDDWHM